MTSVRNLKPFILIFLLGISCITAFVLLDWCSFSDSIKWRWFFFSSTFLAHNHTCVKTEEFDAVTVVSYSNIVSINGHTQSSRLRGYKLLFLQRRLTIALKDQMRWFKEKIVHYILKNISFHSFSPKYGYLSYSNDAFYVQLHTEQ